MNDIEKILGEMEAYVETHAKGWGSKDAAKDHLSQHALCYSATQYIPRLIAAVRILGPTCCTRRSGMRSGIQR
jgi:hypothetical protein